MKKRLAVILSLIVGIWTGAIVMGRKMNKIICDKQVSSQKFLSMYQMMERWLRVRQSGKSLAEYFRGNHWDHIAIYGMGDIGIRLVNELDKSNIEVLYGIDKNVNLVCPIKLYHPEDELPEADVVVVTAIAYFDEIEEILSQKLNCPVVSLEDIVFDMT